MLLAVDIGNTSIKFGSFEGSRLKSKVAIPTLREASALSLGEAVGGKLGSGFEAAIVSSVVPEVESAVTEYLSASFGIAPRFASPDDDYDLIFRFPVDQFGTDRLINAAAAAVKYRTPAIVISFGTATTVDVVGRDREYLGGLIAAGPATALRALHSAASKLPKVEFSAPTDVLGTTTVSAIRSGTFYAQVGLVKLIAAEVKATVGDDAKVIATGGFASLIAGRCDSIDVVDIDLTLEGLSMLYSRQNAKMVDVKI